MEFPFSIRSTERKQEGANSKSAAPTLHLLSLPTEIHHHIATHLIYPDLLSLKLTNTYFATLLGPDLTVRSRVNWVHGRCSQGLPVPQSTKLSFRSDASFVANAEVKEMLRRRRRHLECVECAWARHLMSARYGSKKGKRMCFVTESGPCPKIQELEAKKRRYDDSLAGRVTGSISKSVAWHKEVWRGLNDPNPLVKGVVFHNLYMSVLAVAPWLIALVVGVYLGGLLGRGGLNIGDIVRVI